MNKNTKRLHEIHFPNHSDAYILNDAEIDAQNAWAYGTNAKAIADNSHAEGKNTFAQDEGSHVEGLGTQSSGDYSHVQGKYNQPVENHAFIIGGGSEDNPKNIYSMDWEGNSSQTGNLSVQGKITGNSFSFSNDKLIMENGQVKYLWHDGTHKEIATMSDIPKVDANGAIATYGLSFNVDEGKLNFTSIVKGENTNTSLDLSETFAKKIDLPINDTTITFKPTTDKNIYLTYGRNNLETGKNGYYLEDFGTSIGSRKILSTVDYPADGIPLDKISIEDNKKDTFLNNIGAVKKSGDTMNGSLYIKDSAAIYSGNNWSALEFKRNDTNKTARANIQIGLLTDNSGQQNNRLIFNIAHKNSEGKKGQNGNPQYERYGLPMPDEFEDGENDRWYSILTTKSPVTIGQGGTGANTAAGACSNLIAGQTIAPKRMSVTKDQYWTSGNYGLHLNNSDIVGLNGLYFEDAADTAGEGINFYHSSTTWDRLYAHSGSLYFSPDIATKTHPGTRYTVYHSGNLSSAVWDSQTGPLKETWSDTSSPISLNTLAFWDGRYQSIDNSSNLTYCSLGTFSDLTARWVQFNIGETSSSSVKTVKVPGIPIRFFGCVQSKDSGYKNGVITHLEFSSDGSSKDFNLKQTSSNAAYTAKSSWVYGNSTRETTITITPSTTNVRKYKGYVLILPPPPTIT